MFRPSGTEAKLKVYLDVCEEVGTPSGRYVSAHVRLDSLTAAVEALVS
jgi:phosphomannomutase